MQSVRPYGLLAEGRECAGWALRSKGDRREGDGVGGKRRLDVVVPSSLTVVSVADPKCTVYCRRRLGGSWVAAALGRLAAWPLWRRKSPSKSADAAATTTTTTTHWTVSASLDSPSLLVCSPSCPIIGQTLRSTLPFHQTARNGDCSHLGAPSAAAGAAAPAATAASSSSSSRKRPLVFSVSAHRSAPCAPSLRLHRRACGYVLCVFAFASLCRLFFLP